MISLFSKKFPAYPRHFKDAVDLRDMLRDFEWILDCLGLEICAFGFIAFRCFHVIVTFDIPRLLWGYVYSLLSDIVSSESNDIDVGNFDVRIYSTEQVVLLPVFTHIISPSGLFKSVMYLPLCPLTPLIYPVH